MLLHPSFDICYSSSLVSLDEALVPVPCARGSRYAGRSASNTLRLFMHGIRMLVPFTDRIAARGLAAFVLIFGIGIALSIVVGDDPPDHDIRRSGLGHGHPARHHDPLVHCPGQLLTFVVFDSRGISLAGLEEMVDRGTRDTSSDARLNTHVGSSGTDCDGAPSVASSPTTSRSNWSMSEPEPACSATT